MLKNIDDMTADLLAGLAREGGYTINPAKDGDVPTEGFIVGGIANLCLDLADLRAYTIRDWLTRHAPVAVSHGWFVGIWIDLDKDEVWLDISQAYSDRESAMREASSLGELAIYDLNRGESVPVPQSA